MLKYQKARRIISLVVSIFMVMGCFATNAFGVNNVYAGQINPLKDGTNLIQAKESLFEDAMKKIESVVMDDLKTEDLVEVMVYMKAKADTGMVATETRELLSAKASTPYQTKLQVRRNVVAALDDMAQTSQANLIKYLQAETEKGNVEDFQSYSIVNMVYVKATKEVVENIAYMTEVAKIYKNKTHTLESFKTDENAPAAGEGVEWNVLKTRADEVWALGYDGTGAVVGSLDSGVDWTHPALKNKWRGYDPITGATNAEGNWFDPVYNASLPADSDEHGTHVMGTMVGQEPNGANKVGVAPGAKWITARVFNTSGSTTDAILLAAADWMKAPGGNPDNAPDVVNNSWGGGSGIDDWYRDAVIAWRNAEIVPVFSAGNQRAGEPAPGPGSISCPANYPESFAVAAVDRNDILASFSKLGPSPYDTSLIKPNISAGGVSVRSSIPGGGYDGTFSGTSMSAPAVSGTVALIASANQALTVDEIEELIMSTARPLTDSKFPNAPNMGYGYGFVDAFEAVSQIASGTGYISGRVLVPGEDGAVASIVHEQNIFETYLGSNIEITAHITDDVAVTETELLVKQEGKSYWMVVPMNRISGDHKDGMYMGTISDDMVSGNSIVYKIKARDYADDVVVSEDYMVEVKFGIVPGEYTQGFEEDTNGWMLDGCWEHGIPTTAGPTAYDGQKLIATKLSENYPNSANSWLISPPIDLRNSNLETASLRFYEWYNIAASDFGYLAVTDNYGETWTLARPGITGTRTEWKEAMVNLNDYIGSENPVYVAFNFYSNASGQAAGWYIDHVRLLADDHDAPAIPANLTAKAGLAGIKLSWNHSPDADLAHYNIYRSEVAGEGYVKIAEAVSNSYLDSDITAGTTYYYVIDAVDYANNMSAYTSEVSATAQEVVTLFSTDFENDNGAFVTGVTAGTQNPWQWGVPTSGPTAASSGTKLWATNLSGVYPMSTDAYIETPAIVIPEDKEAILIFNEWVDMEGTTTLWDYAQIMISINDGATWTNITPGGKYGTRVQAWVNREISLAGYTGETVKIRFLFHSDSSVAYNGWYIDDVSVKGIDYVAPEPIDGEELTYDDGTIENAMVMNAAGNGLAVRFTPAQLGKVQALNINLYGNDWPAPGGNRLGFAIFDSNQNQVGSTIFVDNLVRGSFNTIDLSSINFVTDEDFYISTVQDAIGTSCPGTSIDDNEDSDWSRSYQLVSGAFVDLNADEFSGSLMMRAIVDYTTTAAAIQANLGPMKKAAINEIDPTAMKLKDTKIIKPEMVDPPLMKPEMVDPPLMKPEMVNSPSVIGYKTIEDLEVQKMQSIFVGIPVADAVVTVLETGRSVKVDPATGKFSMRVPMGTYTLIAEAYGYYSLEKDVTVLEEQTSKANFVLDPKPQGTITGTVFDRYYGTPAAYAVIRITEDPRIAPVIADENGNFVINGVYEGEYTLKIRADGFESGEATVIVVGNETTNVEIGLKKFVGYEDEIVYDDGTGENALVLNAAGNGLAVRFTPAQYGKVKGANIFFWDNSWPTPGGNRIGFAIYGLDANGQPYQVGAPIFQNIVRGEWNFIDLSSFGFATDEDFYISTIQEGAGTTCPGVGIDEASEHGDRSYMNVAGAFNLISTEEIDGALMIRARMEYAMDIPVITNLSELSYTNQDIITVEGRLTADGKANVYVNGEKITSVDSVNKVFSVQLNLPVDENTIKASAELNGAETEPSAAVVVIKDKQAPVLTVTNPIDNAKVNVELIHVIGNVTDNIKLSNLEVNGKQISLAQSGDFDEKVILVNGTNTITVKATDTAGNVTTVVRTVIAQLQASAITNILPNEDITLTAGQTLTVSFNAPAGGRGYFRLMVPFGLLDNEIGIPMNDNNGLYTGTWTVPEGTEAVSLLIEVVYISEFGHEITEIADGMLIIEADDSNPEPVGITNLLPNEDVQLMAGEEFVISFNAPYGGNAYYRIILPFGPLSNRPGTTMQETQAGLYTATYISDGTTIASDLLIEVIFEKAGVTTTQIASGKLTLAGAMQKLPVSAVIIGDEAFDINYLNTNAYAQQKLIEWYNAGKAVYIKLPDDVIVASNGTEVSYEVLPDTLRYIDRTGVKLFSK
jgi:subtilisin family serine protease